MQLLAMFKQTLSKFRLVIHIRSVALSVMADDEDADEDLDLEHTALYKYMQEQGLVECPLPQEVKNEDEKTMTATSFWTRITDHFTTVSSMLLSCLQSELLVNSAVKTLEEYYLYEHRKVILNSRALMDDDANFLENLSESSVQPSTITLKHKYTYLGLNLRSIVATVMLLLAYSCAKFQTGSSVFSNLSVIVEVIFISALSGYVILKLSKQLTVSRKKKAFLNSLSQVTECVHESEIFLKSAQKCLTYIQELEVIGRGLIFTTAGTSVPKMEQSMLFPRLQSLPSGCLCAPLRICLFSCLKEMFNDSKQATVQLIDSYPLRKEIDNGHYVAYIADQELGTLLTSDMSKAGLSNSTDCLSVSTIKDMGQLFGVQLSEFLRRLALCYYPEFIAESESLHIENCFTLLLPIIKSLCMKVMDASKMLNGSFQFHQNITRERNASSKEGSSVIKSVMSSPRALMTAIKSLALHLQVSIARIDDFTNVFENLDSICRCTLATHENEHSLNPDSYHTLKEQLELIKQDLHSCTLCWEESSLRLQKLGHYQEDCGNLQIPVIVPNENPSDCQSGIPLLEKTDIAPEDEIFEAYVDENEKRNDDEVCYWNLELRKKTAEERNISERMFTELKTILVPKVEEWQKREARALMAAGIMAQRSTCMEKPLEETIIMPQQATENSQSPGGQNVSDDERTKTQQSEPLMPTFSSFNSSIASMVAARSKLLKPTPCETFDSVGDDYCDSDTSNDT